MVTRKLPPQASGHVLVFWGPGFDEAATAIFVTELRHLGLAVKVVGVARQHAAGTYGLLLGSDLTLGDAQTLAHQAIAVILPCSTANIVRLDNDPRVQKLFQHACANHAHFIVQQPDAVEGSQLKELPLPSDYFAAYQEADNLIAFARSFAILLLTSHP